MNFYHAYYKRQYYDENEQTWKDTDYKHQSIIVLAENYEEAKSKIEQCLLKVEGKERYGTYRAVLNSDIRECIGLDGRGGYDVWVMFPIFNT